jgi:hypothetical protein
MIEIGSSSEENGPPFDEYHLSKGNKILDPHQNEIVILSSDDDTTTKNQYPSSRKLHRSDHYRKHREDEQQLHHHSSKELNQRGTLQKSASYHKRRLSSRDIAGPARRNCFGILHVPTR